MENSKNLNISDTIKENLIPIYDKLNSFDTQIQKIIEFSEKEFLVIGDKLQNFHYEAKEITRLSTSLANSMSGEIIRQKYY